MDSTNSPVKSWNISETLTFDPARAMSLIFTGSYNKTIFEDTDSAEDAKSFTAKLRLAISRRSHLSLSTFWSKSSGVISSHIKSGFSAKYSLAYRILRGTVHYKYSDRENVFEQLTNKEHWFLMEIKTVRF
jgi:hypothetical protein